MRKKYQKKIIKKCTEAITFARVSSEKQEKGVSIDAQKELIYDYCLEKGLRIIKEFEITESSTRGDRVKYNEMLDFIRSRNKKTAIVVNCIDRLQRSDEDNPALNKLRKDGKIELHFMKEHIILDETSPVQDIFTWKMNVLMAGNYTDSLSYNVKRSRKRYLNLGQCQGRAPLGYLNRRNDENKAIVIIDPERGPIIKRLYQEYATGKHSIHTIWLLSKELGLTSRAKHHVGEPICQNAIYDILTNPFYYGEMCINGEFYKHNYEPIISKELFDKVQKTFVNNGNHNRNNIEEYAKTPYTFRGIIHCKECGCLITPETKTKKNGKQYIYLRCGHPNRVCHQPIVNENQIIEQLKCELLDKITIPQTLQELLKQKLLQELNDTSAFNKKMKSDITNKLNEIKFKEDNLLDFYLEGKLSQDKYEEKQKQFSQMHQELEQTAEKYKTIDFEMKENIMKTMDLACNISKIFDMASPEKKNGLIRILISDCKLNNKRLEYTVNKPFNRLIADTNYKQWSTLAIDHLDEFECVKI
ncbi:MAG: recombinase family protein [Alphaproteobacteria bacterium]|nr:recombinase family protein [Alphaproteobacteria bacterium]